MNGDNILFTGGSGLLGREMKKLVPLACFPSHKEFDVVNYLYMRKYLNREQHLKRNHIERVIHAAAFTSPPAIDKDPLRAIDSNIIGTSNLVKLCSEKDIRLIYLSTDYVFRGNKGQYREEDSVYPINKYAWSKLGGECAVRMYDNSLIVRTSFGPNIFPFEKAFVDQWTSRESVSDFARKLIRVVDADITGVIHIGSEKKTVFEYATNLDSSKKIGELSISDVDFNAPRDTSLNCRKYNMLMEEIE